MLNLLFPKVCFGCDNQLLKTEEILCYNCRHELPLACHHRNNSEAMKNIFFGKFKVENATALLQFQKKGISQKLLHELKYRHQEKISHFLGAWLGAELAEHAAYNEIDVVIPVPLHKNKLRKRGYNQVSGFGKEIASALNIPFEESLLLKLKKSKTQVFKERFARFFGEEIFSLENPEPLENKHILLVDDIVTTGSTLERCAAQLFKAKNIKLSVATMAVA